MVDLKTKMLACSLLVNISRQREDAGSIPVKLIREILRMVMFELSLIKNNIKPITVSDGHPILANMDAFPQSEK